MLALCLSTACAPQVGRLPTIPPPREAAHDDPARDAQARLLKEAYRAFIQERYPAAALFFRRFVDTAPDSPRLAEARWWLGRTYEQLGDYRAAMAQYRMVTAGPLGQQVNGTLYEGHALRRLDELRQLQADQHDGQARQLALRVAAAELPSGPLLASWLQELVQGGITALVIEFVPAAMSGASEPNLETMKGVVSEAHRLGLFLWVTLDLHQGNGMELRPEWVATTIGGLGQERVATSRPDITNSAYQSHLEWLTRVLSRTGCDGVFLAARSMTGFSEEFSDGSFYAFASSFGTSLSPEEVVAPPQSSDAPAPGRAAMYWRWVGWKARSYAKLVMRLRNVLRDANPTATILVEVHQTTLTAPLQGLEQYGEDLAELMPRNGGSVVVRQEGTGRDALLEKFGQQSGMMDRAWIGIAVKMATIPPSMGELSQALRDLAENGQWKNMLIRTESSPAVP